MKTTLAILSLLFSAFLYSQPTAENFIYSIDSLNINYNNVNIDKVILPYKSKKELRKMGLQKLYQFKETTILYKYWFNERNGVIYNVLLKIYLEVNGKSYLHCIKSLPIYSNNPEKNKIIIKEKKSYLEPIEILGHSPNPIIQKAIDNLKEKTNTSIFIAFIKINYTY